jgi:hypothetical protein
MDELADFNRDGMAGVDQRARPGDQNDIEHKQPENRCEWPESPRGLIRRAIVTIWAA